MSNHPNDHAFAWAVLGIIILLIIISAAYSSPQAADDGSLACDPNAAQTACVSGVER